MYQPSNSKKMEEHEKTENVAELKNVSKKF